MAVRSWLGVALGVALALAVPIAYRVLAELILNGIVRLDRSGAFVQVIHTFETSVLVTLVLGLVGIRIAGRAAGLTSTLGWGLVVILGVPVLLGFWFICFATFGGSIGSPL